MHGTTKKAQGILLCVFLQHIGGKIIGKLTRTKQYESDSPVPENLPLTRNLDGGDMQYFCAERCSTDGKYRVSHEKKKKVSE